MRGRSHDCFSLDCRPKKKKKKNFKNSIKAPINLLFVWILKVFQGSSVRHKLGCQPVAELMGGTRTLGRQGVVEASYDRHSRPDLERDTGTPVSLHSLGFSAS